MSALKEISAAENQKPPFSGNGFYSEEYTNDNLIDAYLQGKKAGLSQGRKAMLDRLKSHINLSGKLTQELINYLKDHDFNPVSAFLKIEAVNNFIYLIVLPASEFESRRVLSAYDFISEFETKHESNDYRFLVSLCGSDEYFNEAAVRADGFTFKHTLS
ncbi:MAG: hypothetical protein V4543_07000 [Bacteroidota bacterium]